jgi:hypothetical protein
MPHKENPVALAGADRAGLQQADAVDSALNRDQSQEPRGLRSGLIATIRKNALEEIRVELSEFSGHDLVNVRVWAEPHNGGTKRIPTRAGIACNVRLLPELIEALQQAEMAARKAGLLGGGP